VGTTKARAHAKIPTKFLALCQFISTVCQRFVNLQFEQ
jgi:hypothetical protein